MTTKGTQDAILQNVASRTINRPEEGRVIGRLNKEDQRYWLAKAHIAYRDLGLTDRSRRLAFLEVFLGYKVRSSYDLTCAQIKGLSLAVMTFPEDAVDMVNDLMRDYATDTSRITP